MEEENPQVEVNEKELDRVRDILRTLTITVKTFNLYPKDNPVYQKVAKEFFEKFNLFFESADELTVDVEQNSLHYKGNEVFHSDERTDNVALLLFADGIRQITFYKGMTAEEITDFIDILRFTFRSEMNDDDDIVTLLWEKNIRNMGYSTAEDTIDDTLAIEESLITEGIGQADIEGISEDGTFSAEPSTKPFATELDTEPLTADEMNTIKNEFSLLEEKVLLSSAVGLFFDLLSQGSDTGAFSEIVQNIGKIIDMRMKDKDIKGTIEILKDLRKISAGYRDPKQLGFMRSVIYKAGSVEKLRTLFRESADSNEIKQYLFLLEQDSIPEMIQILGELGDMKQRKLLCEILAELGKQEIDVLADVLNDERWYLVRNITMILGMTKEPAAVKHLEKVLTHPNLKVRREVIKSLENINAEEAKQLFVVAMKDEDIVIRMRALKVLRRFKDPALFPVFKESISTEELKKKPFEEKKEMLETLAVLGGNNAFPILSELFKKKGFMERDEITEIRAAAAYGLGLVRTPEAISLIEKETGSRKDMLREACMKALKELKSGNIRK